MQYTCPSYELRNKEESTKKTELVLNQQEGNDRDEGEKRVLG